MIHSNSDAAVYGPSQPQGLAGIAAMQFICTVVYTCTIVLLCRCQFIYLNRGRRKPDLFCIFQFPAKYIVNITAGAVRRHSSRAALLPLLPVHPALIQPGPPLESTATANPLGRTSQPQQPTHPSFLFFILCASLDCRAVCGPSLSAPPTFLPYSIYHMLLAHLRGPTP